jgi:hypothetical protein
MTTDPFNEDFESILAEIVRESDKQPQSLKPIVELLALIATSLFNINRRLRTSRNG